MQILVTGGAGFIGSHLTERLLDMGHRVSVVDNFDSFYDPRVKERNITPAQRFPAYILHRCDILDRDQLDKIFQGAPPEMIFHLAAKAGVRPSIADPGSYYRVNVEGTLNLLELCRKYSVPKFVFASTSSIYGNNKKIPFSESDPVDHPISPYAATKKAAELLCHSYHHLFNIGITALRLFTVYGPRQRPDLAIHKFFRLIDRGEPVPIYGDGSTSRDYTYIDDIVKGMAGCINLSPGYEIINLGGSQPVTLSHLVAAIETIAGRKAKRKKLPMQPGDVERTFADIAKARQLLDYDPATDLMTGLKRFHAWFHEAP